MQIKAIIEIPKGSDRRIHMSYDKNGFKDYGSIKEKIPVNDGVMPVCYGYIENAINKTEKDNVDVIIFSNKQYRTGDKIEVEVVGMLNREDGDHKIIAIDDSVAYANFSDVTAQERKLILDYFGHTHKIVVEEKEKAME